MPRKLNPALIGNEAPEASPECFARARPALAQTKEHVNIRLTLMCSVHSKKEVQAGKPG